jgi:aldehyde dehydrogenase (NAD+)
LARSGPIASLQSLLICCYQSIAQFTTETEVIEKVNATESGLSAAVFTNDVNRAQRVSEALEPGQVTINCWGMLHVNIPLGGVKQSGFDRDMGEEALDA